MAVVGRRNEVDKIGEQEIGDGWFIRRIGITRVGWECTYQYIWYGEEREVGR